GGWASATLSSWTAKPRDAATLLLMWEGPCAPTPRRTKAAPTFVSHSEAATEAKLSARSPASWDSCRRLRRDPDNSPEFPGNRQGPARAALPQMARDSSPPAGTIGPPAPAVAHV